MTPRVSVLMSVYNTEKYLKEAIVSILSQSYSDFEFLIIDDGSTDNSVELIKSFNDERIRLILNKNNQGLSNSLNKGINLAQGEYVLRMDADDISLPNRIKKQVEYMDANIEIGICGTWLEDITQDNKEKVIRRLPTDPFQIRFLLLFYNPIGHNSVIIRKKLLLDSKLFYRFSYETAEDYDLWVRASCIFPITNIPEVLVLYRIHQKQVGIKNAVRQKKTIDLIIMEQLKRLNLKPTNKEWYIHNCIFFSYKFNLKEDILEACKWLEKLNMANKHTKVYDIMAHQKFLSEEWFKICYNAKHFGFWILKTYYSSELSRFYKKDIRFNAGFILKCAMKHNS